MRGKGETMKEINLLSKGIFNSKLLDSRVKTRAVTRKEKIFGHLIGPLGMIFIVNTIAGLVEKFFMQMVGLTYPAGPDGSANPLAQAMGDEYQLVVMIARILMVGVGILNGWLLSHTKCKQGRMRPWYLIFSFLTIIIGVLIFLFSPNLFGEAYWVYFFILLACYHTIGTTYFFTYRDSIVSLITHDPKEKMELSFMRKLCWTLISGIIIGFIVGTVLIPFWLQNDIKGYAILLIAMSVCAVPLLLMEYYYTKERVIEDADAESEGGNSNRVPLKEQLKAMFTDRFYVILIVLMTMQGLIDNFKGGNVQYYYVQYLLGICHGNGQFRKPCGGQNAFYDGPPRTSVDGEVDHQRFLHFPQERLARALYLPESICGEEHQARASDGDGARHLRA